ncbi:hypothetical protein ACFE04_019155 [Oxalis oulophora]
MNILHLKNHRYFTTESSTTCSTTHPKKTTFVFHYTIKSDTCQWRSPLLNRKHYVVKARKGDLIQVNEEGNSLEVVVDNKNKGTIAGAVSLIIGTTIGSGILALPQKSSAAGVFPSSVSIIVCWGFLLLEALLLIETNTELWKKKGKTTDSDGELQVISIRSMAQETLGDWGGNLASITYVFLGYTSMIAYSSKSGEIIFQLFNLPESVSGFFFTAIFTLLISIGGTRVTDLVNQWLTVCMIGLLLAIEVLASMFGMTSGEIGSSDWGKIPPTVPVIIFSLVYHDLVPVLCAYLDGDITRLRASVILGSLIPLGALLVWNSIALSLSAQTDQSVDPVELLMRVPWSGVSFMVEAFSLIAVGTSIIGTLLGFSEFFKEQLNNISSTQISKSLQEAEKDDVAINWWERGKTRYGAIALAVVPSLLVSTTVKDAFSTATDIAGGYCMTMLYGVLPPVMAWAMHNNRSKGEDTVTVSTGFWRAKTTLVGLGLFACGILVDQVLQDIF